MTELMEPWDYNKIRYSLQNAESEEDRVLAFDQLKMYIQDSPTDEPEAEALYDKYKGILETAVTSDQTDG